MKLTPAERETIILYDEAGDTANVYTYDHKLIEKLKQLHKKHPDQIYPERPVRHGAVSYAVPKRCVSIRAPYSEERRKADSERAKKAGIAPPGKKAKPVSE